jgi:hypothetical protein
VAPEIPFWGKEKLLFFGAYPEGAYSEVSLKEARDKRDETRKQLAQGINPGEARKAMKTAQADRAANSFEVVAREWYAKQAPT